MENTILPPSSHPNQRDFTAVFIFSPPNEVLLVLPALLYEDPLDLVSLKKTCKFFNRIVNATVPKLYNMVLDETGQDGMIHPTLATPNSSQD